MSDAIKKIEGITKESTQEMIDEALEVYPGEGARRSAPRIWRPTTRRPARACVKSNRKTVPGVMSARGCAYAGAKGWSGARSATWCTSPTVRSAAAGTPGAPGAT